MIELLGDIKVPSSKTGEGLMVKLDHMCLDNQSHYKYAQLCFSDYTFCLKKQFMVIFLSLIMFGPIL